MRSVRNNQAGVALATVLILLVVSIVLGLSSMTSSRFEERMSGNQRNSVAALMAAEAGLTNAQRIIGKKISENESVVRCELDWDVLVAWNGNGGGGGDISAQQNVAYSLSACVSDNDKYRLRSEGVVFAGGAQSAEPIARRWIAAEGFTFSGFLGFSTIMNLGGFNPPDDDFWAGGGNLTVSGRAVDGGYNDAVSVPEGTATSSLTQKEYTEQKISSTKGSVEYNGGVSSGISESMLRDPASFYAFIFGGEIDGQPVVGLREVADNRSGEEPNVVFSSDYFGDVGDERITFIDGDYYAAGDFSGAGVLVVKGDVEFRGTPDFTGLVIVLGDYTIGTGGAGGGGGTGPFNGSLVVSPFLKYSDFIAKSGYVDSDVNLCGFAARCYYHDDDDVVYYQNEEGYLSVVDSSGFVFDEGVLVSGALMESNGGLAVSYDTARISLGQGNANYQYSVDALKAAENALPVDLKEWLNVSNISDNTIEGFAIDRWQEILSIAEGGGWPE